ncbi:dienelactone hydrolase domain protein [Burkholderia mallei]|nr:dienelactone hydrolase domain protein [Burkholderia mallei]KOT00859.1 dienelactone hydrolase domain protein [Burkholderia mallei]
MRMRERGAQRRRACAAHRCRIDVKKAAEVGGARAPRQRRRALMRDRPDGAGRIGTGEASPGVCGRDARFAGRSAARERVRRARRFVRRLRARVAPHDALVDRIQLARPRALLAAAFERERHRIVAAFGPRPCALARHRERAARMLREEAAIRGAAGVVDERHRIDRFDRRIAARLRLVRIRDRIADRGGQAQLREERRDGRPPDRHAVAIDDDPVRVVLVAAEIDEERARAVRHVRVAQLRDERGRPYRIVFAVQPERRHVRARAVRIERVDEVLLPAFAEILTQPAREVDDSAHAARGLGAVRERHEPAVRRAGDDDVPRIDVGQLRHVADRRGDVARLRDAVALDVAAFLDVRAARAGEALAVRRDHRVAAPHELARERQRPAARLRAQIAGILAVVEDHEREGARAIRLVYGRLERDRAGGVDRNADDRFVQIRGDGRQARIAVVEALGVRERAGCAGRVRYARRVGGGGWRRRRIGGQRIGLSGRQHACRDPSRHHLAERHARAHPRELHQTWAILA